MARILVADDVKDVRDLLKAILEQDDHEVVEAETGKQVLKLLEGNKKEKFDLILLDIGFPDIKGTEVMKRISKMEGELPKVCFVSGEKDKTMVMKALQAGGSDYIVKPIDILVLKNKLQKFLGGEAQQTIVIDTDVAANFPDMPKNTKATITKISELGLEFTSTVSFKEKTSINISCPKIDSLMESPIVFSCLIESVTQNKKLGTHSMSCSFSGMHESQRRHLRKLLITGKKISDKN